MFIIIYQNSHKLSHNIVHFSGHSVIFKLYIIMFIVYVSLFGTTKFPRFERSFNHENCQNSSCRKMAETQATHHFVTVKVNKIVDNAIRKNTKRGTKFGMNIFKGI